MTRVQELRRTKLRQGLGVLSGSLSRTGGSSEAESQQSPDAATFTALRFYSMINRLDWDGWPVVNKASRARALKLLPPVWPALDAERLDPGFFTEGRFCIFSRAGQSAALFNHTHIPLLNQHTHTKACMTEWEHQTSFCFSSVVSLFLFKFK